MIRFQKRVSEVNLILVVDVGEVRVDVHHQRGAGVRQKREDGPQKRLDVVAERAVLGGEGVADDVHAEGGGGLDPAAAATANGAVDIGHGGENELGVARGVAVGGADLVADGDVLEIDVGIVVDVISNPNVGVALAGGEILEVLVGDGDVELDAGAAQSVEDGVVRVVGSHSSDVAPLV